MSIEPTAGGPRVEPGGSIVILHVLPVDLARGAQTYARVMRETLDEPNVRHVTMTLFRSSGGSLRPDRSLDVPSGWLRRIGVDPRAVLGLRKVLRSESPSVVVAHGGEPLEYAVLAGVPKARLVYYKIGVGGARLTPVKRAWNRWNLRRAGHVAAVSDAAAREARELGVPDADLRVIPNGRDPDVYAPSAQSHVAAGAVRLVFVGHLTASKRPQRFVELVQALRASGLAVDAVVAGDGPLFDTVRAAAADQSIDVLGAVDDVPALLASGDIFVFTSIPEGEGMPGVLIEAGLAALPVVSTDVPGADSVIVEGKTGFIVPVDDFAALVERVGVLVGDAGLRRRLGDAARVRCTEEFSLDASLQRWRVLLEEIMTGPCTSST